MLTVLHAGGKFDNDSYKVSGGLHGVGVSVVNALSETLDLEIWRNGQVYQQSYERGTPIDGARGRPARRKRRGTKVTFKPDPQIFETTVFSFDTLAQRLRELAFLNGGILITLDDERDGKSHKFHYEGGIVSFVEHLNKNKAAVNEKPIYMQRRARTASTPRSRCSGTTATPRRSITFANNINTHEGGTHLSGFRSALTRTINAYATKNNLAKDLKESVISGDDIREGLTGGHQRQDSAAAVRRPDQDQARQHRGQGHRRGDRQRQARRVSSKRTRRSPKRSSARRSTPPARARRRARRATWSAARARSTAARCPASSPTARSAIRR